MQGTTACYNNETSEVIVGDSFDRDDIAPLNNNIFSWRTIINDNGRIINGTAAKNVELKAYDNSILGETSNGTKSLYFTGRAGAGSVHNLYLVTKSFDLSQTNGIVYFSFDYLPIGLDNGEYLKLEICNNSVDACGVGKISVSLVENLPIKMVVVMPIVLIIAHSLLLTLGLQKEITI